MQPCVRRSCVSLTAHALGGTFAVPVTGTVPDTDAYHLGLHPGTDVG